MTWQEVLEILSLWGPGLIILAGIYGLMRKPPQFVIDLVAAQQAQANAMGQLAASVGHLPQRADLKFDEVLIGQQMILTQLDKMEQECRKRPLECRMANLHASLTLEPKEGPSDSR